MKTLAQRVMEATATEREAYTCSCHAKDDIEAVAWALAEAQRNAPNDADLARRAATADTELNAALVAVVAARAAYMDKIIDVARRLRAGGVS